MLRIKPFSAWRPAPEFAAQVASVPYDVVDRREAAAQAAGNPRSFLRISRAEIELPDTVNPYAPEVYRSCPGKFDAWRANGLLAPGNRPGLLLYRACQGTHVRMASWPAAMWTITAPMSLKNTKKPGRKSEDDRTRHIDALGRPYRAAFLTYRDVPAIDWLMEQAATLLPFV